MNDRRVSWINGRFGGYRIPGYREEAVPEPLARAAEVVWFFSRPRSGPADGSGASAGPHTVLPETGLSLCWEGRRPLSGKGKEWVDSRFLVMGPVHTTRSFDPAPGTEMIGVRLRPEWCAEAFGVAPADLIDGIVAADEAGWPRAVALGDRLARSCGTGEVASVLLRAIGERWEGFGPGRAARLAHEALEPLRSGGPAIPSAGFARKRARELGITPRHLRRVVTGASGSGVKHFERIRRLHRAASLATADPEPRWSSIALRAGFYDQAHMIRDFRELAGMTPGAFHAARGAGATCRGSDLARSSGR